VPHLPMAPAPNRTHGTRWRGFVWAGLAIIVLGVGVLVVALWSFGKFETKVLDVRQAEAGVQQILSDPINGYGANDVESVECNDGENPAIETGKGFTCQVTIDDATRQVEVVFRDDAGTYEVDGPR
jgi:Domain of unknown function (DUF4333)